MPRIDDGQVTETAVEARAGFLDRAVLKVLLISIALVVAIFVVAYADFMKL